jgi:hypothetical protein
MREGLPQQALGQAVVAGVKGGQDVHFLRVQSGHTPWRPNNRAKTRAKLVRDHTFRCRAE